VTAGGAIASSTDDEDMLVPRPQEQDKVGEEQQTWDDGLVEVCLPLVPSKAFAQQQGEAALPPFQAINRVKNATRGAFVYEEAPMWVSGAGTLESSPCVRGALPSADEAISSLSTSSATSSASATAPHVPPQLCTGIEALVRNGLTTMKLIRPSTLKEATAHWKFIARLVRTMTHLITFTLNRYIVDMYTLSMASVLGVPPPCLTGRLLCLQPKQLLAFKCSDVAGEAFRDVETDMMYLHQTVVSRRHA
jgi:hypothetical protein